MSKKIAPIDNNRTNLIIAIICISRHLNLSQPTNFLQNS